MNYVVTGGAGFIGSNIVEKLLSEGKKVSVIDNLHTGTLDNLAGLNVKLYKGNSGDIEKANFEKPEVIIHQGVYSSSPMYKDDRLLTSKALEDFIKILEYARKNDSRIVYATSSSLYNGILPPHKEDMFPLVKDFYTEARYAMERMGELYSVLYGLKVTGLRYFSVYGPKEKSKGKYANLVSQFLWEMMDNKIPVIYGDGGQMRDFVYVSDVVKANLLASEKGKTGIFNVGTGKSLSINHLISILNKKLGKSVTPTYIQNPVKNYVDKTEADTSKTKRELGFEASVTLEQGVEKLIEYYKK